MNTTMTGLVLAALLLASTWLGMRIRRVLPEHHLNADTRDTVKLAMGLVATMTALVLGLLVSSAKGAYDTTRNEVIQMGAKVAFLDRVLAVYGQEAALCRSEFRAAVDQAVCHMWSGKTGRLDGLGSKTFAGDAVYAAIQALSPKNDIERGLKTQALALAVELAQLRTLLLAQSVPSISKPLLIVVVTWLVVIFLSFSLLSPPNPIAALSLAAAAVSVSGAVLLILEMDRPLDGLIQIPREPMVNPVNGLGK